ncbi:MAG TPA: hypothetical protein VFE47_04455 [Tepidisphaeraceae bacterium]|jgi:hypothetical protein|nr:hypothetical protein [Tepidisphaeraceae bacterium]
MAENASPKSSPVPAGESRPYPPRYFWLKRLTATGFLLLIGIAGLRAWWGHVSQSRMDAYIASVQARHEPILPDDFNSPEIPAGDNAAVLYAKAANSLHFSRAESDFEPADPYSPADVQFAAGMILAHAPEIQLIRAARDRHGVNWRNRRSAALLNTYNGARRLAVLMKYVVACEHAQGDDAQAIADAQNLLLLGDRCLKVDPNDISLLVGEGMISMTNDLVMSIAPSLKIAADDKPKRAAAQSQIHALIGELLDEDSFARDSQRDWMGERMLIIKNERASVNSEIHPQLLADFLWPMFQLQALHAAISEDDAAAACRQKNFQSALVSLANVEAPANESILTQSVREDHMNVTHHERVVSIGYEVTATRRVAAIMLAIRLYQARHDGRLPQTLKELTPDYLPAIPLDPFSAANLPLAYLPHHDPPLLYSVGLNGTDEHGSARSARASSTWVWDGQDAVFPYRISAPSTQPAN